MVEGAIDLDTETCEKCLRPSPEPESLQATQWISACRCSRAYSPNTNFSIGICSSCKKRVVDGSGTGKIVPGLCQCTSPEPVDVPAFTRERNQPEKVQVSLEQFELSPENFPSERYTPIAILGEGVKANTLLCRDNQTGKKVAVKYFKQNSDEINKLFEQEARLVAKLSHASIAKLIDFGIHNGKTPYLVSDYKEGYNLEQYLSIYGIPSYDVAVTVLLSICEALEYSQKEGLLHKGLKPSNVLFLDDMNSEPTVVLTDFRFKKLEMLDPIKDVRDTYYMSGDYARNLDHTEKSELYSLGCLGYALLTGSPPFPKGSAREIKNSHALKLPPRISDLKHVGGRPKDLEEMIENCLEKDPRERFDSISKFAERLEIFPRRIKMQIDALEAERKRKKLMKLSIIALIVVAILVVGFLIFAK